jgi:hypothetical protein
MHENRETSEASAGNNSRTAVEGLGRTTRMHAPEESDSGIGPMNHSNKVEQSMAESEFLIASPPIIRDKSRMR